MTPRPILIAAMAALPLLTALPRTSPCFAAEGTTAAAPAPTTTQPTKDDLEKATKWLEQAAASAANLPDDVKATACQTIAETQARAGDVAGAKKTAELLSDPDDKGFALRQVAAVQAAAGDVAGARQTAESIASKQPQAYAYRDIAEARVKAGDLAGARELVDLAKKAADAVTVKIDQQSTLQDVAGAEADAGDLEGARKMADDINHPFMKAMALRMVVTAQARAGDVAGARQAADAIIDDYAKGLALGDVAGAQARAGQVKEALETAGAIENPDARQAAYRQIAAVQLKAGDSAGSRQSLDLAIAATEEVHNPGSKAWAYRCAAIGQAQAGDVPAALKTAGGIEQAYARALAYGAVAEIQDRTGDHAGAKQTLDLAKKSAASIDSSGEKSAYRDIAATGVRTGDAAGVEAWAKSLTEPLPHTCVLEGAACGYLPPVADEN